tara:strand:+ start:77 stop:331 length:255 start_codon:yes stop_codon:yes gene_type:complete
MTKQKRLTFKGYSRVFESNQKYTFNEISEMTGIHKSSVKTRLKYRAEFNEDLLYSRTRRKEDFYPQFMTDAHRTSARYLKMRLR